MHLHIRVHEIHMHVCELAAFYHSFPHYLSDLKPLLKETIRCDKQRKHTLYGLALRGIKMVSKTTNIIKLNIVCQNWSFGFMQ